MRGWRHTPKIVLLAVVLAFASNAAARRGKQPADLNEILNHMAAASKTLKTVSANIDQTSVTVLVDDKSTQSGQLYFRKEKSPEICIDFQTPQRKILLFKKNLGEIFIPNVNQVQQYDLTGKGDLVQQFLLLGFGTDTNELKKDYNIKYLQEFGLDNETTVQLELTPRKASVAAQFSKIQLWISEDSWLPVQQKLFEVGGNYLIAHYTGVKVNRNLPNSVFELHAPSNAKIVKMN